MKKATYKVLTHLPVIGPIIQLKTQPMHCSPGLTDGLFDEQRKLIHAYKKAHPDEAITEQLIKRLLSKKTK